MSHVYPDRSNPIDENVWLEDIHGEKPLAWVLEQNSRTLSMLDTQELADTKARVLEVYDSDDRIPMPTVRGDWLYNFWQNATHPRGLWRRTTLDSYRSDSPA